MKDKIKKFFDDRGVGSFIVLGTLFTMILTLIFWPAFYGNGQEITIKLSIGTIYVLALGVIASGILLYFFQGKYSAFPLLASNIFAFVLFVLDVYRYVSAAFTGIDSQFSFQFFFVFFLFLLDVVSSMVAFFFLNPFRKTASKTMTAVGGLLLAISIAAVPIAEENKAAINKALHTSDSVTEVKKGAEEKDSEYYKSKYKSIAELKKASSALCEEAMGEGAVLLKNENNALPLKEGHRKVSLFSISSIDPSYGGTGSGSVDTSSAPTLKAAFERNGLLSVNPSLWDFYSSDACSQYKRQFVSTGKGVKGIGVIGEVPFHLVDSAAGSSFASYGDAAIVVLTRVGGEGSDLPRGNHALSHLTDSDGRGGDSTSGDYLQLSPKEKDLLSGVKAKKDAGIFSSIVVLFNGANQIQCDFIDDEKYGIDAALWIGTPGTTGFYAIGEILAGQINPSGRLSTTFWYNHKENPALSNFGVHTYDSDDALTSSGYHQDRVYTVYQEGIYVGYKYTETRYMDYVLSSGNPGNFDYYKVVSYPFGYGLSYTKFSYSDFKMQKKGSKNETKYELSVKVKNIGENKGKDVVQVYLSKPYGDYNKENSIEASGVELVAFAKTKELSKGESEEIVIEIDGRNFASYDSYNSKTYVITPGDYYLAIGDSAHDAANNILAKKNITVSSSSNRMSQNGDASLVCDATNQDFDDKTYSTSLTGAKITNQLDCADWNKYEGRGNSSVTYLTRSNWKETLHTDWDDAIKLPWNEQMAKDIDSMGRQEECVLEEDNSAYPTMGADNHLQLINLRVDSEGNEIAYDDEMWDALLDQLTWDEMKNTIAKGMRHSDAIASVGKPENTDHNGPSGLTEKYSYGSTLKQGLANKLNDPDKDSYPMCYPASGILAASFNKDLLFRVGQMIGEDALWAGYAGLYGPGSNIQRTPYSGRNFEYYSEDGYLSGFLCGYETSGMEYMGLYVYNKHFATNDQEDMRRGISVWANEQTLRELYLKAFELPVTIKGQKYEFEGKEITLKGASGVMIAFNRIGFFWAGMNKGLMSEIFRKEWGASGIAVTDMWYGTATPYMNLPQALLAGVNLVDGALKPESNLDMCKKNHANVAWAMREAIHRILYATVHSNVMNGISSNTVIRKVTPIWKIMLNVVIGLSGATLAGGLTWGVLDLVLIKKKEEQGKN